VFASVSKREENLEERAEEIGKRGREIARLRDRDRSTMTRRSERSRIARRIAERWRARPHAEAH